MKTLKSDLVDTPVSDLTARQSNPRTHSKMQIRKIADSIQAFGFVTPILIDADGVIIAGHGRLEAAKLLKMTSVPTLMVDHLTPAEVRAYVIADNQLAALAGWDKKLLALEIAEIAMLDPDLDLTITGFEIADLSFLSDAAASQAGHEEPDVRPPNRSIEPVTQLGDIWQCGPHLLICGDALDPKSYQALLGDERADVVVTDPPYNVPISGHVSGLGANVHREFVMASGELSRGEFQQFLSTMCRQLVRFSKAGSLQYIFMDWRSIGDLLDAGEQHFSALLNVIVWNKGSGGMGSLYRSQHELVALFKNGQGSHKNNVALGANGRYRTNVWDYPGRNSFGKGRNKDLAAHPTVKNCDMIADAIRDVTDTHDIVLDPFGGSGTTLIAAERTGRRARLIELDPHYCDIIVQAAQSEGLEPLLLPGGPPYADVKKLRAQDPRACPTPPTDVQTTDAPSPSTYIDLV